MKKITRKSLNFSFKLTFFCIMLSVCIATSILISPSDVLANSDIGRTALLAATLIEGAEPEALAYSLPVIVIDPGHGGEDGGASGFGIGEKDINLAISQKLRVLLEASGIRTVMTRESDVLLYDSASPAKKKLQDLKNRVQIAKSTENAVFVSIHQNKFPIEKYSGLQVYYSKNSSLSKVLAGMVQTSVKLSLQPDNNREIKAADTSIYVLSKLDIPAVLIECGFLSNETEATKLATYEYQTELAAVICSSIIQYLGIQSE